MEKALVGLTEKELNIINLKLSLQILRNRISELPKNIILKNNPLKNLTLKTPPTRDYERYSLGKYLSFGEVNDIIVDFINTLEEKIPKANLNTIYYNLKTLEVVDKSNVQGKKNEGPLGTYDSVLNRIRINNFFKSTITHELLHFASNVTHNNTTYLGFKQFKDMTLYSKGEGINEGTTEYINNLLFDYPYKEQSYKPLVHITKGIANLIGDEKLIILYFNNDLKGLIEEIAKYSDTETANYIINGMDKLLKYKNKTVARDLLDKLIDLMGTLNLKKQINLLNEGKITESEYELNTAKYTHFYVSGLSLQEQLNKATNKITYKVTDLRNTWLDNIYVDEKTINSMVKGYSKEVSISGKYASSLLANKLRFTLNIMHDEEQKKKSMEDQNYAR